MSDKLAESGEVLGGEDFLAVAARDRENGLELSRLQRERIVASYLMRIRAATMPPTRDGMDWDPGGRAAHEAMKAASPAMSAKEEVVNALTDLCDPPTQDLFEEAVGILLEELDQQRKLAPSPWIVDVNTGRAIAPANKDTIFYPPDYVGEDGKVYKSRPTVHPDITVAIAMRQVETERNAKIAALAADPVHGAAYRHLVDPQSIAVSTRDRLRMAGIEVLIDREADHVLEDEVLIEFGRENVEADLQSVNVSFNRVASYSAVLATKIMRMCGPGGACLVGDVVAESGPKERWYTIPVRVRQVAQA